jgi:hypothetical protein
MKVINARNVNEAYVIGLGYLRAVGEHQDSRVGKVLVAPEPVTTVYRVPSERVLFNVARDANPFFHLFEGLWMLAGRNDVEWIDRYNSTFKQFSDDGVIFNAAYGFRWRKHFDTDQLEDLIKMLRRDPETRRAVISMWDPYADFDSEGKDFPCNLNIAFRINHKRLHMTVFNRSNDMIWGAYGANAVHMSMLHEYMCAMTHNMMGNYYQVSNNMHAYTDILEKVGTPDPHPSCPYDRGAVKTRRLVDDPSTFDTDLQAWIAEPLRQQMALYSNSFFTEVATPMQWAWEFHKLKKYPQALEHVSKIQATDWQLACRQWITRRAEAYATKTDQKRGRGSKVAHDSADSGADGSGA